MVERNLGLQRTVDLIVLPPDEVDVSRGKHRARRRGFQGVNDSLVIAREGHFVEQARVVQLLRGILDLLLGCGFARLQSGDL
jgi:hypothetical protein